MPTFVVVTGLPASGKTTLAASLARELGFDHLDKDAFLDDLLEHEGCNTAERRYELSRRADALFREQAAAREFAVLSSWWKHPESGEDSGTQVDWLRTEGTRLVEVHCKCPATVAASRFASRRRHPGHGDSGRPMHSLLDQFTSAGRLGPLFPGSVLTCDTEFPVSGERLARLVATIRHRIEPAKGV